MEASAYTSLVLKAPRGVTISCLTVPTTGIRESGFLLTQQATMMQSMPDDIETDIDTSRPSEATRLRSIITSHSHGLAICGVSGPGGIGKSYLIDHVLSSIDPAKSGWLTLHTDASHAQLRGDFFALVDGQMARRSIGPPADPGVDYFPQTRRVAAAHRALVTRVSNELERDGAPEDVKRAAVAILKAGHLLNKVIPKTREVVDVAKMNLDPGEVADVVDEGWETVNALKALRDAGWMPDPLRDRLSTTLMSRVKRDLYGVTADALISDLSSILYDEPTKKSDKKSKYRIPRLKRLIIVIDDYEALETTLGDFLISSLIPRLAEAPFATVLIIGGRDDLEDTNPGWSQHCSRYLAEPIRLRPFDVETAVALMAAEGIPESRQAVIYELTQGVPFLLSLVIEEAGTEGTSALFLKRFFDRTTRWMGREEIDWFVRTCYLDEVNEDTLRYVFPEQDVGDVQDWFESESSIRDPSAPVFRVRPLIREKVLSYQEVRSPRQHQELLSSSRPPG